MRVWWLYRYYVFQYVTVVVTRGQQGWCTVEREMQVSQKVLLRVQYSSTSTIVDIFREPLYYCQVRYLLLYCTVVLFFFE